MNAVEGGFEDVADEAFGDGEEAEDGEGGAPAVGFGDGDGEGHEAGEGGSDVGQEAEDEAEGAPEAGAGDVEEPESESEGGAEAGVDGELEEDVAGDAVAGVIHGFGGGLEFLLAHKAEEAVAQVLAVNEHEEGEDDDEAGGAEGSEGGADPGADGPEGAAAGNDFDLKRGDGAGLARVVDLAAEVFEGGEEVSEAAGFALDELDFVADVLRVGAHAADDVEELGEDEPAHDGEQGAGEDDDDAGGGGAGDSPGFEAFDDGAEEEGEEQGEGEGDEEFAGDVEDGDGEDETEDRGKLRTAGGFAGWQDCDLNRRGARGLYLRPGPAPAAGVSASLWSLSSLSSLRRAAIFRASGMRPVARRKTSYASRVVAISL